MSKELKYKTVRNNRRMRTIKKDGTVNSNELIRNTSNFIDRKKFAKFAKYQTELSLLLKRMPEEEAYLEFFKCNPNLRNLDVIGSFAQISGKAFPVSYEKMKNALKETILEDKKRIAIKKRQSELLKHSLKRTLQKNDNNIELSVKEFLSRNPETKEIKKLEKIFEEILKQNLNQTKVKNISEEKEDGYYER